MIRSIVFALAAGLTALLAAAPPAPAKTHHRSTPDYGYDTPVEARPPGGGRRHARRNTGRSPIAARYHADRPWSFTTGKGIFSTPIVGGDGQANPPFDFSA